MKNLLAGNTSGYHSSEIHSTTRAALVDLHQKTDYQGDIIKEIGKDIHTANKNLENVTVDVKGQGEQLGRVQTGIKETGVSVKRTDKKVTVMSRRNFWHKCLLHTLAVLLFIAIGVVIVYKILSHQGK
jgi:hypothetical protein